MEGTFGYLFVVFILISLIVEGVSVRCYFCSYSPDDRNNRTDKCTEENFQHHNVHSNDCEHGCETFIQYDANEALEQYRRNCAGNDEITNDCKMEKNVARKRIKCTCDRDLCNNGANFRSTECLVASIWTVYFWLR